MITLNSSRKAVKLPIVGRCYICGKPITEDGFYADVMDGR